MTACQICGKPGREFCRGRAVPFCNYRARVKLGVKRWTALALLEAEKKQRGIA